MMSRGPVRLTVALITFNRAASYLPEAIAAIQRQTYSDFEFLILDGGSTDATAEVVLSIDDPRIRYVRNAVGTSMNFNNHAAHHIATGWRVIGTHDDDVMEATMLAEQMAFMDAHPDVKLVWTNVRRIDPQGREIDPDAQFSGEARIFAPGEYIESFLHERLWPWPSAVMFERRLAPPHYVKEHYFQTSPPKVRNERDYAGAGDVDLPARINIRHSIAFLDRPLLRYRIHPNQDTHKTDLSRPSIHLFTDLKRLARRIPGRPIDAALFDSQILKHKLQHVLSDSRDPRLSAKSRRSLIELYRRAFADGPRSPEALAIALPVYLAGKLSANVGPLPEHRDNLPFPSSLKPEVQAFHRWAVAADDGKSLFSSLPDGVRLVILGSVLVAALMVMDAERHGITVVACIDSNVHRHSQKLLGVPIHPLTWLRENPDAYDYVVLTSERTDAAYLEQYLEGIVGEPVPTASWKGLAAAVTPPGATLSLTSHRVQDHPSPSGPGTT